MISKKISPAWSVTSLTRHAVLHSPLLMPCFLSVNNPKLYTSYNWGPIKLDQGPGEPSHDLLHCAMQGSTFPTSDFRRFVKSSIAIFLLMCVHGTIVNPALLISQYLRLLRRSIVSFAWHSDKLHLSPTDCCALRLIVHSGYN